MKKSINNNPKKSVYHGSKYEPIAREVYKSFLMTLEKKQQDKNM